MTSAARINHGFVGQRSLEGLGGALKTSLYAGRQADLLSGPLDRRHRVAERVARREIERERDGRELSLTAHDQRRGRFRDLREHVQRDLAAAEDRTSRNCNDCGPC